MEKDMVQSAPAGYRLIAMLRGRALFAALPDAKVPGISSGQRVLAFSGPQFDSCRIVPATPSALAAVQDAPIPVRRAEDEPPGSIQ